MKKKKQWQEIKRLLEEIYGTKEALQLASQLQKTTSDFKKKLTGKNSHQLLKKASLTHKDIALITYANTIEDEKGKQTPLQALKKLLVKHKVTKAVNSVHLLPFYPWDTDRGFSVCDYYKVNPSNGNWQDIDELSKQIKLMFDFVANHASINNPIIQAALIERHLSQKDKRYKKFAFYKNFAIAYSKINKPTEKQLQSLARPRPNPVLTKYTVLEDKKGKLKAILGNPLSKNKNEKVLGNGWVWTTFSRPLNKDGSQTTRQVDLNFANPNVFLKTIKVILFYVNKGALLIRLDAIGYIWKRLGSSSLHEKECHLILEAINKVLKTTIPGLTAIAEVNEPQDKVFTYLGDKDHAESDLVYQFTHFPLAIHAILTENGSFYKKWLETTKPFEGRQFTTVLGSHDGLGLKPVRGILPEKEISKLQEILIKKHKALSNHAFLPGGKKIVYEICATPWHLINQPGSKETFKQQLNRYLTVVALGLTVRGIPAFYINGLLGAKNYQPAKGLDENRTINREVFSFSQLSKKLDNRNNRQQQIMKAVLRLITIRTQQEAFSPLAPAIKGANFNSPGIIDLWLPADHKTKGILSLVNLSSHQQRITVVKNKLPLKKNKWLDLISGQKINLGSQNKTFLSIDPYQTMWLKTIS